MATEVRNLKTFLNSAAGLLKTVRWCRAVLLPLSLRELASKAIEEALPRLEEEAGRIENMQGEHSRDLEAAGLTGASLDFKLRSFEVALGKFEVDGGDYNLSEVLDRATIILGSLAGAIPGFGSISKELVDYLNKEIRRRGRISGTL
jgi:hypothetical protein